tara:strand:+ start:507 stop:743 length:237 start_codon:yes stop_codon:yes gene_type:complete
MDFKSFINFESLITTSLIKSIYILASLASVISILFMPDVSIGLQLLMILGALLGIRFYCEILIVMFKISENVSKIANK